MAQALDFTTTSDAPGRAALRRIRAAFTTVFAGLGHGFAAVAVARARMDQLERLNAKSDAQLGAMGLRREDIPRHVFRDILYL